MTSNTNNPFNEHFGILKHLIKWFILVLPIGIVIGSMVVLFLWLLSAATQFRFNHTWLLYLLPIAGILIHFIYQTIGKSAEKGNNLILEQIHEEGGGVPKRMAPIILITTLITHLFGGSAGREGTAVQIGGSIASMFGDWFKLQGIDKKTILIAGVAAGFGAVFGTPLTGAIFAMEVLAIGKIQYQALLPALMAALIGDLTVNAWDIHHIQYHINSFSSANTGFLEHRLHFDMLLLGKVVLSSIAFGLVSLVFAILVREIKSICLQIFKYKWMIPVFGGLLIITITLLLGKPDYLGLGVDAQYPGAITIPTAFNTGGAGLWSWLCKTIYTTITLGTGFKGGEVTPLFYIGATLGNTLANILNAPVSLFAALGFIAVFAGATNTPIACTFMGVELFGGQYVLLFAIACFTAYLFSGHTGIYGAQRIAIPKILGDSPNHENNSLSRMMDRKGYLHQKLSKYYKSTKKN
jgi:H+/Cl- antiporter ClcA